MYYIDFDQANASLDPPKDWNTDLYGPCGTLPVLYEPQYGKFTSIWKPTDKELEILNNGGGIALEVISSAMPPVALNAVTVGTPETSVPQDHVLLMKEAMGQVDGLIRHWKRKSNHDGTYSYVGQIFHDKRERYQDGDFLRTSAVQSGPDQHNVIRTRNSVYLLDPDTPL